MQAAGLGVATVLAMGISASGAQWVAAASQDTDLAAFSNGALVESVGNQYGNGWTARWLTAGQSDSGWSSDAVDAGPFTIVIALPERSEIHALEFDTAGGPQPACC